MSKVKDKEKILKAAKEKQLALYYGTPIRQSADFLAEAFQARTICSKCWKKKPPNQEYSTWQSYHSEMKERESFSDTQKLKEFIIIKPALEEC